MKDLIERQAAIDALTNYFAKWAEYAVWNHAVKNMVNVAQNSVEEMLIQLPSAQPQRKSAYLIDPNPYGKCSDCGQLIDIRDEYNYCPNCGARLEGESDE